MLDKGNYKTKMEKVITALMSSLKTVKVGRASTDLLDNVKVNAYGGIVPIVQVASISVIDNQTIGANVWDASLVAEVDKAIQNSGIGITPMVDGQLLKLIIPKMSQERRKEMVKVVSKYAEESKVSVRNIRREGINDIKEKQNSKEISEDESHKDQKLMQDLTDEYINKIDKIAKDKESQILTT